MGVRTVAWHRYGHRRTYVNDEDGTSLGYRDEATGEVHVMVAERAADVRAAFAVPARVPTPVPVKAPVPVAAPVSVPEPPRRAPDPRRQAAARKGLAVRSWRRPTLSEKALADELLRTSPFAWAREVVFGEYRLDFYCAAARLAVEVDGSSHRHKAATDAARDAHFVSLGIETVRVTAAAVEKDPASVVARLNRECVARVGSVPPTEVPAPGLVARLLGRKQPVARAPLAPEEYSGRRRGGAFVCARCRTERPPADRSTRSAGCCTACATA